MLPAVISEAFSAITLMRAASIVPAVIWDALILTALTVLADSVPVNMPVGPINVNLVAQPSTFALLVIASATVCASVPAFLASSISFFTSPSQRTHVPLVPI